jgi:hypothetical protein
MIRILSIISLLSVISSCTKTRTLYNYHDINRKNSTYYFSPSHVFDYFPDSAIVRFKFYGVYLGGTHPITEGIKLTINNDVQYLDTTDNYWAKLKRGAYTFSVETKGFYYPVKTKKLYIYAPGACSINFYLVDASNDSAIMRRPFDPNYKTRKSRRNPSQQ